jgi:O-Antigen ligase
VTIRRVLAIFTFLLFVQEDDTTNYRNWLSPFGWANSFFFLKLPQQIRPFDHILLVCLLIALGRTEGKGPRVAPMKSTLLLGVGTIVTWLVLGLVRGGNVRWGCWQIYIPLSGILFSFTIAAVFRNPKDFRLLAKVLLAAAAYRAAMCWAYYFSQVRTKIVPIPEYITNHDDSVLWTVAILILILRILRASRFSERLSSVLFILFIVGAIQFNTRRLAWAELGMGLVVFLFCLPPGKVKRRVRKAALALVPVFGIYVVVGWGRTERIFKPLQAFSTMTTKQDESTISRNYENVGLISTSKQNGWLLGTGWGHEYQPVTMKYDLSKYFQIWRYIPHNSVLGLLAFTGVLGFSGYWLMFPTAVFLNSRVARMAKSDMARDVGIIGAAQMIVCVNQYFGDMGLFSYKVVYIMSTSYAIALRMPILSGVWPVPGAVARRVEAPQEARAVGDAWQA